MYKNATKCNETIGKWCKNKHGASKIIDTFETYQSSRQNLNVEVEIYHEGKTPGSILCGPVYAHGYALLVHICIYDAKKILVDALGILRTTGVHSL
jgi:hypothetical protein